ncbi:MAG: hypothetical protein R3E79_56640 [Caldilineaceae bacterium]
MNQSETLGIKDERSGGARLFREDKFRQALSRAIDLGHYPIDRVWAIPRL